MAARCQVITAEDSDSQVQILHMVGTCFCGQVKYRLLLLNV